VGKLISLAFAKARKGSVPGVKVPDCNEAPPRLNRNLELDSLVAKDVAECSINIIENGLKVNRNFCQNHANLKIFWPHSSFAIDRPAAMPAGAVGFDPCQYAISFWWERPW
jgi:hypothetical protein